MMTTGRIQPILKTDENLSNQQKKQPFIPIIKPIESVTTFESVDEFTNYYQQHKEELDQLSTCKLNKMFKIIVDPLKIAKIIHTHSISDITNLQTTLDNKASHTHVSTDVTDIQTYVDNRITAKFNQLFDLLHPIGSIIMLQNALSVLGATPTFDNNHLYYSWNETTWEYLPDAVFIRNGTIYSNTHEETGATLTTSGSNTHNHTTADHTLTKNEMPSHNHSIFCSETNQKQGNNQKLLSSDTYGQYGNWLNQTNYWIGEGKPQPFISYEGSSQPHNHGNTSTESNVPVHVVAYFYVRIA